MEVLCGYDVKHATHCLRLLYQAFHIIQERILLVDVEDFTPEECNFLRSVKQGEVPYDVLIHTTEDLFTQLKNLPVNNLPNQPTDDLITNLFIDVLMLHEKR